MTVRERPILFSAPMVRALLDGRKTETRRVAKFTSGGHVKGPCNDRRWHPADPDAALACPYGQPRDRLWVRETWATSHRFDHLPPRLIPQDAHIHFAATEDRGGLLWRPSIFMPRWASRITLELTAVRIERLNDISLEGARAEGWAGRELADPNPYVWFSTLWLSLNGPGSWLANSWVWILEFGRL